MGKVKTTYSWNMDIAVDNARILSAYQEEGRSFFRLKPEEVHPELPLPENVPEGRFWAGMYRFLGGIPDRRADSNLVWQNHREWWTQRNLETVLTWTREDAREWVAHTNNVVNQYKLNPFEWPGVYQILIGCQAGDEPGTAPSMPASQFQQHLKTIVGVGDQIAAAACMYVYDSLGWEFDELAKPKADLHDARFSLTTGELVFKDGRPGHSRADEFVQEHMRLTALEAEVDPSVYKHARWIVTRAINGFLDRSPAKHLDSRAMVVGDLFHELFGDRIEHWVARRGVYTKVSTVSFRQNGELFGEEEHQQIVNLGADLGVNVDANRIKRYDPVAEQPSLLD